MSSSKREEERNEKIIRGLMKLPPNRRCINCNSLGPQYVCTNFWTFVCTICSGIHREFTHRVKSVSMSKFTSQEVEGLQNGGNQRAKEIFLKNWEMHRQRLPNSSDVDRVRDFIKTVYVDRKYAGGTTSEKPPKDMESPRNMEDETRRASSYHSYSQSPPYDFQYEERLNRKHGGTLTRKPGSDHGFFERKTASFVFSPGRYSNPAYEDRFANDGSSSRASDFSVSNRGDPLRSGPQSPQSPNLRKDDGSSSPSVHSTGDIVDNLHSKVNSVNADTYGKKDAPRAPVPLPQRTVSSGSVGSSNSNLVSVQSVNSLSFFDDSLEHGQSAVPSVDGVNLFNSSLARATSTTVGSDMFKVPTGGSVVSIDLFQPTADSLPVSQNFQAPQNSLPSHFNNLSQGPFVTSLSEKNEMSQQNDVGWATFDSTAQSTPGANNLDIVGPSSHPENGMSTGSDTLSSSKVGLEWADFSNTPVQLPPSLASNLWDNGLQNVPVPNNMPNSQPWNAFEDNNEQHQFGGVQQNVELEVSLGNPLSVTDLYTGLKTSEGSNLDELQSLSSSSGASFPSLPSYVGSGVPVTEPVLPFRGEAALIKQKSCNPFDTDSGFEESNTFLDMSAFHAALPAAPQSPPFVEGLNESWFTSNSVNSQGGMSFMTAQMQSTQFPNIQTQGPVASIGGNPFA